jgi:hypothetical protein
MGIINTEDLQASMTATTTHEIYNHPDTPANHQANSSTN